MSLEWLLEPWGSALMRRAFLEAVLTGATCGVLGCFVLVRGLAFLGEGLAHTLVLGVVLAFLLGVPVGFMALLVAALTVGASRAIGADRRFSPDVAMGILLPALFGLGVVLIAGAEGYRSRLEGTLFGAILGTTDGDLVLAGAVAGATVLALLLTGKELVLASFDRAAAAAMGYGLRGLDLLLLGLVALTTVVALRAVGSVLLAALLLGPPLIARRVSATFWPMAALSAGLGVFAGILGLYASWHWDVGGGPAIVLVVVALFGVVGLGARLLQRGLGVLAAALLCLVAGCGGEDERAGGGGEPLRVVATTMQLADFAREVGGSRVQVDGILDAGSEPHDYEPTPSDADTVSSAGLVIANGANLDSWLDDLLENAGADARRIDAVAGIELLPTEEEGFPGDPHVWHDPELAKRMVATVATGLTAADPAGKAAYERNAARYSDEIDAMAEEIRRIFAPIPPTRRTLVTNHDAFGYFARAYDVRVVGTVFASLGTETEPSAQQVQALAERIRAEGVRTIFTEEAVDPRLERQIAQEAGATVSASLYADALAPSGPPATYIGAELANARAMASAWR